MKVKRPRTLKRNGKDDTKARQVLRANEDRFRVSINNAPVMLWVSGVNARCTHFNRHWLEFTGQPLETQIGDGWVVGIHPDDFKVILDAYAHAVKRYEAFTVRYRLRCHNGEYRWVLEMGVPRYTPNGHFAGYVGSAVDVTSIMAEEQALAGLSHRLIEAHENERTRIGRELHDDVGQRLAVLTMDLDGLAEVLPLPLSELRARIAALSTQTRELLKDVQGMSHRLHSSKLEYLGLAGACASFCREVSDRQDVRVEFRHLDIPKDLPNDVALSLFRVLQEAVNNAVKHAGVRTVRVTLLRNGGEIELDVVDAGRGFDAQTAVSGPGLGLISMRERLTLVQGELQVASAPGAGTRIRARVQVHGTGEIPVALA